MTQPLGGFAYSVVIPAFNAALTIRAAIESILAQSLPAERVIVVDDGSGDDTAAIASAMPGPVMVVRKENGGPGSATNAGIRNVATPFLATLDADDLWLPEKAARQAACLAADPAIAGVFTLARQFADGNTPLADGGGAVQRLWTRTTLMFRTEAALAVGDFVDMPGYVGDAIDWLARSRELGQRHVMLEEVLALRRVRPGSLSQSGERSRGYLATIREALERKKRAASGEQADRGPR